MKFFRYLVILLIIFSVSALGCISSGGNNNLEEALKSTSKNVDSFIFLDYEKIRSDDDLEDIYDDFDDGLKEGLGAYEINIKNVRYISVSNGDSRDSNLVIGGEFDLEELEDDLDDAGFSDDRYSGVKVMMISSDNYYDEYNYVGLFNEDKILIVDEVEDEGNIEDMIDVSQGDKRSLYIDNDFKELVGELSGFYITVETEEYGEYGEYDGLEIQGSSYSKKNPDELILTFVYKFDSDDDADDSIDDIEDDFEDIIDTMNGEVNKVYRKGDMVIALGTIDIEDFSYF